MKTFIFSIILLLALGTDSYGQITEPSLNDNLISQEDVKKVIVYGSDSCHYCIDTKAYLNEKNIDFIYYDVDVNLLSQKEMLQKLQKAGISLDNLILPVVDLKGELILNSSNFEGFLKKLTVSKK